MNTNTLTFSIIIIYIIILYLAYKSNRNSAAITKTIQKRILNPDEEKNEKANTLQHKWLICVLLAVAALLISFSIYAPFFFTGKTFGTNFDFCDTGQIGDTIGGLANPFIALSGVVVTGLAFYMQYQANNQQREFFLREQADNKKKYEGQINHQNKQYRLQQFESQFYEMIRLHRENVSEMKIDGYDFEEERATRRLTKIDAVTEGRKVFVTMQTELESILGVYKALYNNLDKQSFLKCYKIFFSGLTRFKRDNGEDTFFKRLSTLRKIHEYPNLNKCRSNRKRKNHAGGITLYFNYKPYSGHASRLGHYFRHLYLAVKSVVYSNTLESKDEKMKYLRILRAQLSNHEQILLFYNWLSGYGKEWENDKHTFFTEFNMIHNLWYDSMLEDEYIESIIDELREKAKRIGNDDMFEID
jgi:hypothetical protein